MKRIAVVSMVFGGVALVAMVVAAGYWLGKQGGSVVDVSHPAKLQDPALPSFQKIAGLATAREGHEKPRVTVAFRGTQDVEATSFQVIPESSPIDTVTVRPKGDLIIVNDEEQSPEAFAAWVELYLQVTSTLDADPMILHMAPDCTHEQWGRFLEIGRANGIKIWYVNRISQSP